MNVGGAPASRGRGTGEARETGFRTDCRNVRYVHASVHKHAEELVDGMEHMRVQYSTVSHRAVQYM